MLNLSIPVLTQVVDTALQSAANHPRWLNAINRAVAELVENPYISQQDGHLLIASPSGAIYSANGVCQCEAFTHGQPCWHRAAARLVRLHNEARQDAERRARWAAAQVAIDECFA
jgi:hypothetical protein